MNEQLSYTAKTKPISEDVFRPLWSVMIPTYNCANYLRETLASVLAQDPGSEIMQIEVVDDYSTKDDPKSIVEELGQGRVSFFRQSENVGHVKNFETCIERSRGQLIHLLHGDDCVRDGFYRKLAQAFEQQPETGAAFCRHIGMNEGGHWLWVSNLEQSESGILTNWLEKIALYQRIQTPSIVVRREIYENLGLFDRRLSWAEDWEMWVRIASHYSTWYETEPLALYRIHSSSNSIRYMRSGENVRDLRRAIAIIKTHLPPQYAEDWNEKSKEHWAFFSVTHVAREMISRGDVTAAIIQLREALKCSQSQRVIKQAIQLFFQIGKYTIKKSLHSA